MQNCIENYSHQHNNVETMLQTGNRINNFLAETQNTAKENTTN